MRQPTRSDEEIWEGVQAGLAECGLRAVEHRFFPKHYAFTTEDLEEKAVLEKIESTLMSMGYELQALTG
jgi:hypothetical protein